MTDTNSFELEVERKIQATTNAFGALLPKLKMCNATVLPSLLNGTGCSSKSWQVHYYTAKMAGRNSWCRSAQEPLTVTMELPSPHINFSQFCWRGNFNRINNSSPSRAVFYGNQCRERELLTARNYILKDMFKWHMKKCASWKDQAVDHSKWLRAIAAIEGKRRKNNQKANERRLLNSL